MDTGLRRAEMPGDVATLEAAVRDPGEAACGGCLFSRTLYLGRGCAAALSPEVQIRQFAVEKTRQDARDRVRLP